MFRLRESFGLMGGEEGGGPVGTGDMATRKHCVYVENWSKPPQDDAYCD